MIDIKTCSNCGHRENNRCMLSGHYCTTERLYPSECGTDFKGWISRVRIGLKKWVISLWSGKNN